MKIAVPSCENMVDAHFGHCEYFTVFTVNDKKEIISQENLIPSAECGCKSNLADTLADMGVTLMLAGNMGQGAVNKLQMAGISVVRGCAGNVKAVTEKWLAGTISDSGKACSAHEHGHNCAH